MMNYSSTLEVISDGTDPTVRHFTSGGICMMLGTHDGPDLVGCVAQGWGQGCTGKMHLFGNLKSTAN
jgi:hypothetical protein